MQGGRAGRRAGSGRWRRDDGAGALRPSARESGAGRVRGGERGRRAPGGRGAQRDGREVVVSRAQAGCGGRRGARTALGDGRPGRAGAVPCRSPRGGGLLRGAVRRFRAALGRAAARAPRGGGRAGGVGRERRRAAGKRG